MQLVFIAEPSSLALDLQREGDSKCDRENICQIGNKQKHAGSTLHLDNSLSNCRDCFMWVINPLNLVSFIEK